MCKKKMSPQNYLFTCGLFNDAVHSSGYTALNDKMISKMNCKGYARMQAWPNLRYYPSVCLEAWRKTTKTCGQPEFRLRSEPRTS
jgi:hypothetical protein